MTNRLADTSDAYVASKQLDSRTSERVKAGMSDACEQHRRLAGSAKLSTGLRWVQQGAAQVHYPRAVFFAYHSTFGEFSFVTPPFLATADVGRENPSNRFGGRFSVFFTS